MLDCCLLIVYSGSIVFILSLPAHGIWFTLLPSSAQKRFPGAALFTEFYEFTMVLLFNTARLYSDTIRYVLNCCKVDSKVPVYILGSIDLVAI